MSKTFQVSTLSTMGLGGGTIKRQSTCALLLIIGMIMCIFPSAVGAIDQVASGNSATIGLSENKNVLVHAASKTKKVKSTKKTSKSVKKTTKKVKAASKYKVKVRYYYRGKWRYKYVTKYRTVSAASSYTQSIPSSSYTSSGTADTSNPTLDAIMKSDAGFGYSSAYHTATDLEKYGCGDCWAFSEDLNNKFQAGGYQSRVIQYATSYSSQHRSVQLYQNGQWLTVPYKAYGYNYLIM